MCIRRGELLKILVLGRGPEVDIRLVSHMSPLMLSRKHCTLTPTADGFWNIIDNKSLNGVFVNGIHLEPLVPYTLIPDDIVQLGIRLQNKTDPEFQYIFLKEPSLTPCHEHGSNKQDWCQNKDGKTGKTDFVEESSRVDHTIDHLATHLQATSSSQLLQKQTKKILVKGQQDVGQNCPEIVEQCTNDKVNDGIAQPGVMNRSECEERDLHRLNLCWQCLVIYNRESILDPQAKTRQKEAACHTMSVMESELQCSICSELFIKAMTLNCSHTFCSHCINEWRNRKAECPVCRKAVSTCTPSLAINLCVEHIVLGMDEDIQQHRRELLAARTKKEGVCVPCIVFLFFKLYFLF
uniref:E3 ubiquitin-protein ligase CHFR n=1 Tax=Eptatretus burgeri TaxID=7764 RepID=A0A8C4QZF5_EPTBU